MNPVAAALVDLDGTLVDSNEFHVQAWHEAFAAEGHELAPDAIRRQVGKGADQLIPSLLPGENDEAGVGKRIAERHGAIFKGRYMPQVKPLPGAAALVRFLHRSGVKVVLASSASREEVDHYAALLAIEDAITARTSSDDVERTKPAADVFDAALRKVAPLQPAEALVIGDTPYDIIAAARCGIAAIALLSGGFDETWLREAGAIAVYPDASALLTAFRSDLRLATRRLPT